VKLITWNVNGIRARQHELNDLIAAESPDVVCLQEIKASPEQIPLLLSALDGFSCCWHGAGGYAGVALLARHAFFTQPPVFGHPSFDVDRRIVVADLGGIDVASVYVPNGGRDYDQKLQFLQGLADWAIETNARGRALLICGDLNVAREDRDVHPKERKPNQIGTRPEERALIGRVLEAGFVDVGRTLDPDNDNLFTWWAPWRNLRQRNIGWRIDYVLASPLLAPRVRACEARREFGTSDHGPVIATFES
jgi:exodeoxyribonuclease-3